jgi:Site-specific DNA methylase
VKSEVINIKTPVSRVGNKTAILHILYALFPLHYGRFIDVFGGSGSVLLGKPTIDAFEVTTTFDRNLVNLFRCMKERTMATIRELASAISIPERTSLRSANSLTTRHSMTGS